MPRPLTRTRPTTHRRTGTLLSLAAVATLAAAPAAQARTVTVTKSRSGKSISLVKGDKLVVRLSENPSTGYAWRTLSKPSSLRIVSSRYVPPTSGDAMGPLPGAPGTRVYTYLAKAKGIGTLRLSSVGPTGARGGSFTLRVTVR